MKAPGSSKTKLSDENSSVSENSVVCRYIYEPNRVALLKKVKWN